LQIKLRQKKEAELSASLIPFGRTERFGFSRIGLGLGFSDLLDSFGFSSLDIESTL
jgi:hypothetical protein